MLGTNIAAAESDRRFYGARARRDERAARASGQRDLRQSDEPRDDHDQHVYADGSGRNRGPWHSRERWNHVNVHAHAAAGARYGLHCDDHHGSARHLGQRVARELCLELHQRNRADNRIHQSRERRGRRTAEPKNSGEVQSGHESRDDHGRRSIHSPDYGRLGSGYGNRHLRRSREYCVIYAHGEPRAEYAIHCRDRSHRAERERQFDRRQLPMEFHNWRQRE